MAPDSRSGSRLGLTHPGLGVIVVRTAPRQTTRLMPRRKPNPRLASALDTLPEDPGVYLMKGRDGSTIYVGKAKNLRRRVRSYFQPARRDNRRRFRALVRSVVDVDCVLTATEQEALVLEALQIRGLRPRFNVALKEDREYPFVRVTAERFPRFLATREFCEDGSRYFGPFSNIKAMYDTLNLIIARFGLRTCARRLPCPSTTPCLEFHLHRCCAPCRGSIGEAAYDQAVDEAVRVLQGRHEGVLAELRTSMQEAADVQSYEQAGRCRDRIQALEFMRERQKVWLDEPVNRDVVGLSRSRERVSCSLLAIRDGHLQGSRHLVSPRAADVSNTESVLAFLRQHYDDTDSIPDEIQATMEPPPLRRLRELVGAACRAPVWVIPEGRPQMQELADFNARRMLATDRAKASGTGN
jgi:excinuclease ABC subunit C